MWPQGGAKSIACKPHKFFICAIFNLYLQKKRFYFIIFMKQPLFDSSGVSVYVDLFKVTDVMEQPPLFDKSSEVRGQLLWGGGGSWET